MSKCLNPDGTWNSIVEVTITPGGMMESKLDKFCKKAFGQLPPRDTRTQWVRAGRARGRREGFLMAIKVMEKEMRNLTDLRAAGAQQCRATLYQFAKLCTEKE